MEMDIDPDCYDDDEDSQVFVQPQDMPQNCWKKVQSMGGTSTVLLAHKSLSSADLGGAKRQSFSLPNYSINYAFHNFLRDDEKILLNSRDQYGFPNTINTLLLDTSWDAWNVPLRKWVADYSIDENSVYEYELGEPWLSVVRENELNEGNVVQLWAFRVDFDRQLWLALIKVEGAKYDELSVASLNIC